MSFAASFPAWQNGAMRTLALLTCLALGLVACGPSKKPVKDATDKSEDKNDAKEDKWEGATSDDLKARDKPTPAGATDATPAGSSGPTHQAPVEAATRRSDQYDKDATDVVLKRAARQVKGNCGSSTDESGKANGPWGKVTISVNLGHNGHTKGVTVPAPYDGTPSGRCITQAFSSLTFPPWSGSDTTVDQEVELVKPGK
jgi:hypothetical protein